MFAVSKIYRNGYLIITNQNYISRQFAKYWPLKVKLGHFRYFIWIGTLLIYLVLYTGNDEKVF